MPSGLPENFKVESVAYLGKKSKGLLKF